jgi:hypothetical protein
MMAFPSFVTIRFQTGDGIFAFLANAKLSVNSIFERNKLSSLYRLKQQASWETSSETLLSSMMRVLEASGSQ